MKQPATFWSAARRAFRTFRNDWRGATKRTYDAAKVNRLTADWPFIPISANRELRTSLRTLRNRMRNLAQNDDYIKKFLSMVVANVPGPNGMTLRVDFAAHGNSTTDRDEALAEEISESFKEWSRPENASASGKLSFVAQQRLFWRTIARDGEVLIRKVICNNRWGFSLKFIDVSWLDELWNTTLPDGNRILMSVEVDQDDRPVAYWLTMPPSEYLWGARLQSTPFRQRVPASEFIHAFLVTEDESQVRGVPWAHTAMMRLKILGGYEEAELVTARVNACRMAWLTPPKDEDEEFKGEPQLDENGQPIRPEVIEEMQPGITSVLPPGYDVKENAPMHPNPNYPGFIKAALRGISAGLEVSYNSLANDLEGVNYSSIRAGLLEERDVWRGLQTYGIDHFNHPIFMFWLRMATLAGAIDLSPRDFARVRDKWKPRGWAWVDPLKDVQATILAVNNGLESRSDDADERGDDFFENVKRLGKEKKAMDAEGLNPVPVQAKPTVKKETEDEIADDQSGKDEEADGEDAARVLPILDFHLRQPIPINGRH